MYRVRLRLAKTEFAKFVSHLETMQALARGARRARLPLVLTQGFNPHAKISWGPPLSVGQTSDSEYLDLFLEKFIRPEEVKARLNEALPEHLRIVGAKYVYKDAPSLGGIIAVASYEVAVEVVPVPGNDQLTAARARFFEKGSFEVKRKKGMRTKQADKAVRRMEMNVRDGVVELDLSLALGADGLKPSEVCELLFGANGQSHTVLAAKRTGLFAENRGDLVTPFDLAD